MNEILINVLFLLVVLLITQYILEVYPKQITRKLVSLYSFFAGLFSIYFCMTFPFPVNDGFNIDIRIVPFLIASLYGGPIASFGLYFFIVIYRLSLGLDFGFAGATINYLFVPILISIFHKSFLKSETKKKLCISLSIVVLHFFIAQFVYQIVFVSNTPFKIILLGNLIKFACVALAVFSIERVKVHHQIRMKLVDIEKMEIISHLSASISHEIRNGLTGAKGFIQLLSENERNKEKRRYISIALEEIERSEEIIRDFLTFAKPAPEKEEKINMEQLLDNIIEIIRPLANMHSIEILKSLVPYEIFAEKRTIQQALLNIIKNGIESMPNGGQLQVSMNPSENKLEITIADTGIGMDSEQIERLGRPYFTTKGQKGTGLGMMVSFRVIEELKGKISVESEKGRGTIFKIHIPIFHE